MISRTTFSSLMDYLKRRYTLTVKPIVIKIALRVLGSLAAVLGLSMLGFSLVFLSPITSMKPDLAFSVVVGAIQILLGLYLSYVGYLVWFRLSPHAVRHVLGTLAFVLLGALGSSADHHRLIRSSDVFEAISFAIGVIAFYILYRCMVAYCCNRLFPATPRDPAVVRQ